MPGAVERREAPLALITGAPGWLGTRLVQRLAGREIRCLVHPQADPRDLDGLPGVTCVRGDVTQPQTLAAFVDRSRGATLFHCAGLIHPRRVSSFARVNAAGTRHMLDAAVRAGVGRFVHLSSNSPFGANRDRDQVFTEDAPFHPYMGYGRSKMAAEQFVAAAGAALDTVTVRAPWFYGPGQPARQTQFFTMIKRGTFPILGDGTQRRSMAYVENLCDGLVLCETRAHAGDVFWIADERPYSINEIVDTVERVLHRDFRIPVSRRRLRLPSLTADVARLCDRGMQAIGLYDQRVHVLSEMNLTIACSIDKARRQLGYQPAVTLEEGMRRSVAWVMSNGGAI